MLNIMLAALVHGEVSSMDVAKAQVRMDLNNDVAMTISGSFHFTFTASQMRKARHEVRL